MHRLDSFLYVKQHIDEVPKKSKDPKAKKKTDKQKYTHKARNQKKVK